MWVDKGAQLIVGLHVTGIEVEPVLTGEVGIEEMRCPTMVKDKVHDVFDALLMAVCDKALEFLVRPYSGVNLVVVCDGISMVASLWHIVGEDGCGPYGGDTEVVEICEVAVHACQIAAVAAVGFVTAKGAVLHSEAVVVGGVTVGKAVGDEEIENVRGIETSKAERGARTDFIGLPQTAFSVSYQHDVEGLGACMANVEIEDEVVGVFCTDSAQECDIAGVIQTDTAG